MLHSIIGMVDRCKRALAVLQERSIHDHEELAAWMRRHSDSLDTDMKKRTSDLMASTLRHTEDRVSEVKRRAGKLLESSDFWLGSALKCLETLPGSWMQYAVFHSREAAKKSCLRKGLL